MVQQQKKGMGKWGASQRPCRGEYSRSPVRDFTVFWGMAKEASEEWWGKKKEGVHG
jgi:hypothetical protein